MWLLNHVIPTSDHFINRLITQCISYACFQIHNYSYFSEVFPQRLLKQGEFRNQADKLFVCLGALFFLPAFLQFFFNYKSKEGRFFF